MLKVTLRQAAIDDLEAIWEYTYEQWSEEQADRYYLAIKLACKSIESNPTIGRKYSEIQNDLLGLKSGRHIIFYHLISENEIEVIRILHERMDLKNRLNEL